MIDIKIDKLYRYDRTSEPCFVGFPLKKGVLKDLKTVSIYQNGNKLPHQAKATSRYDDGSVRFIFLRFLADIPANKSVTLNCELHDKVKNEFRPFNPLYVDSNDGQYSFSTISEDTNMLFSFRVKDCSDRLFDELISEGRKYNGEKFTGPHLRDKNGKAFEFKLDKWQIVEKGPVCAILKATGKHILSGSEATQTPTFEVKLTAYAGKSYVEVSYRIINSTDEPLAIEKLEFDANIGGDSGPTKTPPDGSFVFHAGSTQEAEQVNELLPEGSIRTIAASSNYKTDYLIGKEGNAVSKFVDADYLLSEANEHFSEVFYGTFFADYTDNEKGVAATVFQAQQNFPKAVEADKNGIRIMLVPANTDSVVLRSGVSREQKFLLHFHAPRMPISEINNQSIIYQMPYRPYVSPQVHMESGVWPDIFPRKINYRFEQNIIGRADAHGRAYGMLNFGDSYDSNYTSQGRGGGRLVYCNNEYDYPHACALLFARTGFRRFLDYNIASASHWMDVDVCHYHKDPIFIGGQWEHTAGHVIDGVMVCSHEWVEGLLDYYHFTGDERGLETAIGIGRNVDKLLDTPMFAKPGEANARETGWALRTLTALYVETNDKFWLTKCDRIVNDFKTWEDQYGHWLAPYTDNTVIRVGFMISVAVGSLMRYYKVKQDPEIKGMIIRAVDDLIENCYIKEWGIFYYKELPSLNRLGTNTLLLEALTAAYDLTKDPRYIECGMETYNNAISEKQPYSGSSKRKVEDTVLVGTVSSKNFAQSMIPITGFHRALSELEE